MLCKIPSAHLHILLGLSYNELYLFVCTGLNLGGAAVPGVKRIMISLPESLLAEVDDFAMLEKRNRSEFIREAMKLYIAERKRRTIREQMKNGYQEMAKINLSLAEENYDVENEAQKIFDNQLAECR